jgi:hypothetical protein
MLSINARKAYIRYREDLPDSVNNFAALSDLGPEEHEHERFREAGERAVRWHR